MPYCPHCGNAVKQLPENEPVHEAVNAEVEIARINAERDVEVARIAARGERDWNETRVEVAEIEAEAEVAAAVAEAEVIGDAIEASAVQDAEPVIIDAPADPVDEPAPDDALPEVEGSAPPETNTKRKIGLGAW